MRELLFFSSTTSLIGTVGQGNYAAPDNAFDAIMAGIDRAGLAGWYLEPNNIIERASGNTLGLRPLLGNRRQYDPSLKTYAAILGGPTGSQAATIAGIVGDLAGGEYDRYTAKAIRKVMPWQNVAHVDWLYDQIEAGLRSMQPAPPEAMIGTRTTSRIARSTRSSSPSP